MKTKKLINSALIGSLMIASLVQAANTVSEKGKNLMSQEQIEKSNKTVKAFEKKQNALLEKVNQGVLDGYEKVLEATQLLLQDDKEQQAIRLLQEATGKFDIAIAANPDLKLIPIDGHVAITAFITTPEWVKKETNTVIDLLKNHKVQAAQTILEPMKDEMVIVNTYLPMGTYPNAIKLATQYLLDGDNENAVATLDTSLSTVVIQEAIIPLAIIRTESLLTEASKLDKTKEKEAVVKLLDAASEQLEIATLLGYTDKETIAYESLKAQIKAVKKEVNGKNVVEKMYDKVKVSIKSLIGKENTVNK